MSGPTPPTSEETDNPQPDPARHELARDAIAGAAKLLGGAEALAAWVRADDKNKEKFWVTLYPKLIPLQAAEQDGSVSIAAAIEAARKRAREMPATLADEAGEDAA